MNIRPAQPGDLPALLEIFAHARAFMAQTGNPTQWPATYPGAELMQQQIARGVCYVLEGNARPEATFCYIPGPEPTYAEIYDGGWPDDAPYATIHRMASAGRVHGAAAICFAWCAARGLPLRADTHADNKVMQHLLEKNGFVRCGNITLADGTSRIAYHCTVPPRGGKQQTVAQAAAALAQAAKALPKPADGPLLVALDGRCAAGKTTIAAQMARQYGWGVVHLDDPCAPGSRGATACLTAARWRLSPALYRCPRRRSFCWKVPTPATRTCGITAPCTPLWMWSLPSSCAALPRAPRKSWKISKPDGFPKRKPILHISRSRNGAK